MNITGTFLDFSHRTNLPEPLDRDAGFWQRELGDIKAAGMDTIIINRVMDRGRTYYHSRHFEEYTETDTVAAVMDAAAAHGLEVWLGLYMNVTFWQRSKNFSRMLERDARFCLLLFDELMERYAAHPCLKGIYIADEADRDNVDTPERAGILKDFFTNVCAHIKRKRNWPVMISPFFSKSVPPAELAAWWDQFLDRPMFDILAMQDSVGCTRDMAPADVGPYYAALAPVLAAHGVRFWNNVETFIHAPRPADYQHFELPDFERILQQYRAGAPYTEKTITWEYGHFLGRQQVGELRYQEFCRLNRNGNK